MRRISITIAIALALCILYPSSICLAQQTATALQTSTSDGNPAKATNLNGGPDTVVNCANAATNYIPVFTSSAPPNIIICNSLMYQLNSNIGIDNTSPVAKLDVNGAISTSRYYQIGGSTVLSIGSSADHNVFLGVGAGANNVAGSGKGNTFSGYEAGVANTTGSANTFFGDLAGENNTTGYENTFVGLAAGLSNTIGNDNTFVGHFAGLSNTGSNNAFYGEKAGYSNTTGYYNTFSGFIAGYGNTTGVDNTFSGAGAGYYNTTGYDNTFSGLSAGYQNTTGYDNTFSGTGAGDHNTVGSSNIFYGFFAGFNNQTGNNNIYIGNLGSNSGSESNAIRIGGDIGTGYGPQTAVYIVGIYGSTASGGVPVYINSNGQLGTSASSLRFKEQVRDMGDSTNALMKLRPVTFLYKPEYANGDRTLQFGLIAEEVAKVYPQLVAYDQDGQPYSVRYQYLTTMLLNEAQKQYRRAEAEAKVITTQQQKINDLEQRLSRLEGLVRAQVQTVAEERE